MSVRASSVGCSGLSPSIVDKLIPSALPRKRSFLTDTQQKVGLFLSDRWGDYDLQGKGVNCIKSHPFGQNLLYFINANLQNPLCHNYCICIRVVSNPCFCETVLMPKMLGLRIALDPSQSNACKPTGFQI